jgi:hypothetical protein
MTKKYSDRARRLILFAALSLASLSLIASCARKTPPKPQNASLVQAPASTPPASAAHPAVPGPLAAPKPPPLAASMRGFGLGAPSVPRIAWDYSLGPLQSYHPAEGDEAAVFAAAKTFVTDLSAGKLDKELLLPEARDALSALLAPAPSGSAREGAIPYRLGAIVLQGSDASLRLRFPYAAGENREEGLLSLRKVDQKWYVEALALDPPASGPLAFNPDASAGVQSR